MEEEVTQKTIALSIKTTKVTADVLRMMLRKYLEAQKQKGPNPYKQGKQTYDQLREQGVVCPISRLRMAILNPLNVWQGNLRLILL